MATYNKKNIEDVAVQGKTVLVRCDFNVPMKDGTITSDKRIVEALPTVKYLLNNGAKVVLCSHMGKPHNIFTEGFGLTKKEKKIVEKLPEAEQAAAKAEFLSKAVASDKKKLTLKPVCDRINELLGETKVTFAEDIIGPDAKAKVAALKAGEAVLLENTRFDAREEKNGADFAKELASYADLFVNDAFGAAHRAHASTAGVADYIPAVCGYLIEKEISVMGKALSNPERPFVAILGGAKVADKPGVTRQNQWFAIGSGIELLDTPGVLWPKFDDPKVGDRLAFIGSVKNEVLDSETMAVRLIEVLVDGYEDKLTGRYKLKNIPDVHSVMAWEILEEIGRERGMLIKGGEVNTERASVMLLEEYRNCKIGFISLERCKDYA